MQALRIIREDIGDCTRCRPAQARTQADRLRRRQSECGPDVHRRGPGRRRRQQGEPFVGRAGQLLNNMIKAMGLQREDVYIANIIKCRPPGNRTPERDECETCSPFLMRQIAVIKPKVIVALGAVAAKTLSGDQRADVGVARPLVRLPRNQAGSYLSSRHSCCAIRDRKRKRGKICRW